MKLSSLYERLSPNERFKASISAASRKDLQEWDLLIDTSPMRTLRSQEPSYFARVRHLHLLALLHSSTRRERLLCGTACLLCVTNLDSVLEDGATDEQLDKTDEALGSAAAVAFARARGMDLAFDAFTTELGLDPREVRAAFGLDSNELLSDLETLWNLDVDQPNAREAEEAEEAERREWRQCLDQFWHRSIAEQYSTLERSFEQNDSTRKN